MTARVLCFAGAKGGAGASTVAMGVGTLLAGRGHTTLLVEAAPIAGAVTFGYLHALLERRDAANEPLFGVAECGAPEPYQFSYAFVAPHLAVIPSSYRPGGRHERSAEAFGRSLVALVHEASSLFDYVVLDTSSVATPVAIAAGSLADDVVVVSECDAQSVAALECAALPGTGPFDRRRRWILPNKVTTETGTLLRELDGDGRVLPPIPDDREVKRAFAAGHVPIDVVQPNLFTIAVTNALTSFVGSSGGLAVEFDRAGERSAAPVRRDVMQRYQQIAAERDSLRSRYLQLAARAHGRQPLTQRSVMFGAAAAVAAVLWLAAGGAIELGANPAWRALGFLLLIAGASTGMLTWFLLTRRLTLRGDFDDIVMELEAIEERLAELAEQQQKWRPLFEDCLTR